MFKKIRSSLVIPNRSAGPRVGAVLLALLLGAAQCCPGAEAVSRKLPVDPVCPPGFNCTQPPNAH